MSFEKRTLVLFYIRFKSREDAMALSGLLPEYMYSFVDQLDEHPWLFSGLASVLVGLSGIFPLLVIPLDATDTFTDGREYYVYLR